MKALIVDDEPMPAKHLKILVEKHCFEIASLEMLHSPVVALQHLKDHTYDVLFLDVEMPGMTGFELLEKANLPATTQVIFTTAYSQYALDAFKVNAAHYILKPVVTEELIQALRKALKMSNYQPKPPNTNPSADHERITIFHNDEHHILATKDILRLEADGSYTKVVLQKQQIISSKSLGHFEKKLPTDHFFRCHHSHLINLNALVKIGKGRPGYVVLSNEDVVPVAQSKKEELEKRVGI
ncbi:MAG: LytR/AlgR family response regulator transcription factor [Salibacteraceae bacterium]